MNLHLAIGPLVSLIAGILILIVPRLLNFIVAIYLILIGLIGLFGSNLKLCVLSRRYRRDSTLDRSEAFAGREVAPLPGRQVAERDAADAHALQAEHLQADLLAHAADLPLLAFLGGRSAAGRR